MRDTLRSPQQKQLRKLLRELRVRHGLTQEQVAERLDRPQSFVAK
jgi:transcriptional regulator with XRE-family HTH domain